MEAKMDLTLLYSRYTDYIRAAQFPAVSRNNKFARRLWGNPLTFEQFCAAWERICRDAALQEHWERRLEAGYEACLEEARALTRQFIACAQFPSREPIVTQAIPA